jgi:hypothetical protein
MMSSRAMIRLKMGIVGNDSLCLHHQGLIRERKPSKFLVLARLIPQEELTVKQHIIGAEVSLAIYIECTVLWCVVLWTETSY